MKTTVITIHYTVPQGLFCNHIDRKEFEASFCEYLDNLDMKCDVFNTSISYSRKDEAYEKCPDCLNASLLKRNGE